MAVTALHAATTLIIVDLQHGIVGYPFIHPIGEVIERSRALLDAFRERGLPVVLVNVSGFAPGRTERPRRSADLPPDWADLIAQLGHQPSDILVTKRQWGAFYGTDLDLQLRRRGIKSVVLGGISTNIGVESTALAAWEHGYELVIAEDLCSAQNAEMHQFAFDNIFPRLARVRSTREIVAALDQ